MLFQVNDKVQRVVLNNDINELISDLNETIDYFSKDEKFFTINLILTPTTATRVFEELVCYSDDYILFEEDNLQSVTDILNDSVEPNIVTIGILRNPNSANEVFVGKYKGYSSEDKLIYVESPLANNKVISHLLTNCTDRILIFSFDD